MFNMDRYNAVWATMIQLDVLSPVIAKSLTRTGAEQLFIFSSFLIARAWAKRPMEPIEIDRLIADGGDAHISRIIRRQPVADTTYETMYISANMSK